VVPIDTNITVQLPAAYQRHAQGQRTVCLPQAGSVPDVLAALVGRFAGLKSQLLAADGQPYRSVAVFVNGVDVRRLQGMDTRLSSGDVLTLVPAISGG
jgi:sulfur-carrier protein